MPSPASGAAPPRRRAAIFPRPLAAKHRTTHSGDARLAFPRDTEPMTNSNLTDSAIAATVAAHDEAGRLGTLYCELVNLKAQQAAGNKRAWVAELTTEHGAITDERLDAVRVERIAANSAATAAATEAYRIALSEGLAFAVVDHSDRLKTRPFEVAWSSRLVGATHVTAHGSHLHLARYATRAAAERVITETTAAELARLS